MCKKKHYSYILQLNHIFQGHTWHACIVLCAIIFYNLTTFCEGGNSSFYSNFHYFKEYLFYIMKCNSFMLLLIKKKKIIMLPFNTNRNLNMSMKKNKETFKIIIKWSRVNSRKLGKLCHKITLENKNFK